MTYIPSNLTDSDFLQGGLDFSDITPEDFENLVFQLLEEMGFSNIQWRKGGPGNSATDGGRDLEATFWSIQPAGSHELTYWIEVKYRTNSLERVQVQATINNAAADVTLDNLIIVTNSTITNPTLDWISTFQSGHQRPRISTWQGHDLEALLRKNPSTLNRFLPHVLSFSGRCKVNESRFSNLLLTPSMDELAEYWTNKESEFISPTLLLAICIAELTYGDISKRPWPMVISEEKLSELSIISMGNVFPLLMRVVDHSRPQSPLIESIAYIIQCASIRLGVECATEFMLDPERFFENPYSFPLPVQQRRLHPILSRIYGTLASQCSTAESCRKLSYLSKDEDESYFYRFLTPSIENENENEQILVLSSITDPCEIDLVATDHHCPLGGDDISEELSREQILEKLEFAAQVINSRLEKLATET